MPDSPNYSIPVWSSDTYFSEGDRVVVHMNTRRRPRGISGEITNTEFRNGRRMHEVKGHWYPERDLRPMRTTDSPDSLKEEVKQFRKTEETFHLIFSILFLILGCGLLAWIL